MPKASSPRRKRFSISQIFRRRKNQLQEKTQSTVAESSSAEETSLPSSFRQSTLSSATETKASYTALTNREDEHAPSHSAHSSDTIFPQSSGSYKCSVDHSSNNSTRHYDLWHDEPIPVGLRRNHAASHPSFNLDVASTESQITLRKSELNLPPRNSPDTPFSPVRNTSHYPPGPSETAFSHDAISERGSPSRYAPSTAKIAFSQVDLPLRRIPVPTRSSPKETPSNGHSPAELDGTHTTRPYFSGHFGSDFILPAHAPTERAFSLRARNSVIESAASQDSSDFDLPVTPPTERTFGLRHDNSIELPINSGSSQSVDSFGYSVPNEATPKTHNEYEDVLEDHEDGIAYEDDEAWCGKCGGLWWGDRDKYKTFWGERPGFEELAEGEIERWRCHRCKQVRIRKKRIEVAETEAAGSVESFMTATGMVATSHAYDC